jgi:hypothetical protein
MNNLQDDEQKILTLSKRRIIIHISSFDIPLTRGSRTQLVLSFHPKSVSSPCTFPFPCDGGGGGSGFCGSCGCPDSGMAPVATKCSSGSACRAGGAGGARPGLYRNGLGPGLTMSSRVCAFARCTTSARSIVRCQGGGENAENDVTVSFIDARLR